MLRSTFVEFAGGGIAPTVGWPVQLGRIRCERVL